jgi:hypothetical protein
LLERHRGIRACTTKQPSAGLTRSRPGHTPLRGMQWRAPMVRFIAYGHGCRRYKGGMNHGLALFAADCCLQRREELRPDSSTACSGAGSTRSMAGRVPYSQRSCSCCGRTSANLSFLAHFTLSDFRTLLHGTQSAWSAERSTRHVGSIDAYQGSRRSGSAGSDTVPKWKRSALSRSTTS